MTPSDPPPGLRGEQLAAWGAIATLLVRLPAALDAQLQRDSGVTHYEHGLLYALDATDDRALRMSVLAGYANSTLSRLSRAISRLERKGWVRREVDPSDGRFTLAVLTEEGRQQVARATPAHHALVEELVFDSLTEAQVRQLAAASRRITAVIDDTPAWEPSATN
ncbi:MarR family winged helix-turn-helix transcriptional regulator [Arenivirga flava]|uniref:MarR family transcriptional regulator n=1 Tax=Arenivirga flava TaxID=1930060 RepID=A0AA37UHD7_9MICO|nr:MarR family transcriptional regulator [Arenivirga flava]GMA28868.1 MarR family transcriptional regulator [Arenivirga flava]